MKKLVALLVLFVLVLGCTTGLATGSGFVTDEVFECGDYSYRLLEDGTAEIVRWSGTDEELTIAAELDGYAVSRIGERSFSDCSTLVSVVVPHGIIEIEDAAFNWCDQLQSVTLPETLKKMGYYSFVSCNLVSITIPDSVIEIGEAIFAGNKGLCEIIVSPDHPTLEVVDGALVDKANKCLVCVPSGLNKQSFSFPDGIQRIGEEAFFGCERLVLLNIPDTVIEIGLNAFFHCTELATIVIPDKVLSLEAMTFQGCANLREVVVSPEHPTLSVKDGVLFDKNGETLLFCPPGYMMKTYAIPDGVTSIATFAFENCGNIEQIIIPEGVVALGPSFVDCWNLETVVIPNSLVTIEYQPFIACSRLTNLEISPDHPALEFVDGALISKEDHLLISYLQTSTTENNSYSIPQGVTIIGDQAFSEAYTLEEINIPDTVTSIGKYAFLWCESLQTVVIPDSVTTIEMSAFGYCTALTTATIPVSVKEIGADAFSGCPNLILRVVPGSVGETYAISENIPYEYKQYVEVQYIK